ncbi:MAG: sigma-70 family RNA polymerase sigma factor [Lachnospiraceae bacterium]|nr:sigma-70 family RNA polymerase sigma factor [Lachnospiraceae bacterium]
MNIKEMTDEELVLELQKCENEEMVAEVFGRFKGLVRSRATSLYLEGGDRDDLIQEGMIGLFEAVKKYTPGKEAKFSTFATLCVNRKMWSAIEKHTGLKHSMLNEYVSLSREAYVHDDEGGGITREEQIENLRDINPEDQILSRERVNEIDWIIENKLSDMEKKAMKMFIRGLNYVEIAEILEVSPKTVDNALNRAKNKLKEEIKKLPND